MGSFYLVSDCEGLKHVENNLYFVIYL